MVNNNNLTYQHIKNPRILLRNISILLKRINKILKSLDQRVFVYRKNLKDRTCFFCIPTYDSEIRAQIIFAIQKELRVYHYYKKVTISFLSKTFCLKKQQHF